MNYLILINLPQKPIKNIFLWGKCVGNPCHHTKKKNLNFISPTKNPYFISPIKKKKKKALAPLVEKTLAIIGKEKHVLKKKKKKVEIILHHLLHPRSPKTLRKNLVTITD